MVIIVNKHIINDMHSGYVTANWQYDWFEEPFTYTRFMFALLFLAYNLKPR